MDECRCERLVRLDVEWDGKTYWICNVCNAQFIPKKAVDYKIASLVAELGRRMIDEQGSGMREQDSVSEQT